MKKSISTVSLAICAQFVLYWLFRFVVAPQLGLSDKAERLMNYFVLYFLGLGLMYLVSRGVDGQKPEAKPFHDYLFAFCLILSATPLVFLIKIAESVIRGGSENIVKSFDWVYLLAVLAIAPISEELSTRFIPGNRTIQHDGRTFLLLSATLFAFSHLVGLGPSGVLYTFYLGYVLAYLYLKSRNILLSIFCHILYNLLLGVISTALSTYVSDESAAVYLFALMLVSVAAVVYVIKHREKLKLEGDCGVAACNVFSSPAVWLYIFLNIAVYVMKLTVL